MLRITDGDVGRTEIGTQDAFRWRGLFHLCNHAGLTSGDFGTQAGFEAADAASCRCVALHITSQASKIAIFLCCGDFVDFDFEDFFQDIVHGESGSAQLLRHLHELRQLGARGAGCHCFPCFC